MRESVVERYLHREVERAGGTTRKFASASRANNPDRIVIWPGSINALPGSIRSVARVHFAECKAPGKKPRPAQQREHVRLHKLGCVVVVLDTIEKINSYVITHKEPT